MTEWADYESGPFCRHFWDPSECETRCAHCGHLCREHEFEGGDTHCEGDAEADCECEAWVEPEED